MKRSWTALPAPSKDRMECEPLEEAPLTLKRIRPAESPSEIRLNEDLTNLPRFYGWQRVNDRRWMFRPASVLMETTNDPSRMLLTFPQQYQVWIQLPSNYPIGCPCISKILHPRIQQIHVAPADQSQQLLASSYATNEMLIYNQWSPAQQLGDLLNFLVEVLPHAA